MRARKKARTPAERLRDLKSVVAEHFPNFLVITGADSGGIMWVSSDRSWAVGAASLYGSMMDEDARDSRRGCDCTE